MKKILFLLLVSFSALAQSPYIQCPPQYTCVPNITLAGGVVGSGTTNYVPIWSSANSLTNSSITQSAGVVSMPTLSVSNNLFVGNPTATGQAVDIKHNTGTLSIGSLVGSTSVPAIYGNQPTPSGTNYALAPGLGFTILNSTTVLQFAIGGTTLVRGIAAGWFFGGTSTATARIHIAAGTASAGTAPLKLTSGTNLGTAETGAFEYNGTNLFFTRTGTTRENIITTPSVNVVSPTSPNRTITVVIDGTTYYIAAKTTND